MRYQTKLGWSVVHWQSRWNFSRRYECYFGTWGVYWQISTARGVFLQFAPYIILRFLQLYPWSLRYLQKYHTSFRNCKYSIPSGLLNGSISDLTANQQTFPRTVPTHESYNPAFGNRYSIQCKVSECNFKLHTTSVDDSSTFRIKIFRSHRQLF